MTFWLIGIGVAIVLLLLLAWMRARREYRRSSREMRDHVRRNSRLGQQPWE